ncbi:MAG: ABC transporter substrate-binding protein [Pseudomonadota bacterium]
MTRAAIARRSLLALTAVMPLAAGTPALAAEGVIRIGEINHFKRLAAFAEPYRKGMDLGIAEINNAGGVLDRRLEIIYRDDQGEPGEAIRIAEELVRRQRVAMITGTILSNVGLALSSWAKERGVVYLASEPLADAIVWADHAPTTFRLRASTWMQAAMLAEQAAKTDAIRYATIAPNYAYGRDAVAAFEANLKRLKPDVEFVAKQWPALFQIDAGAEVEALAAAEPEAIYNVTFGGDLAKFVREGTTRGLFEGRQVYGLLTGEPEYLEPLGAEAPVGWVVTGYPWYAVQAPAARAFVTAYTNAYNEPPKNGSLVGYTTAKAVAAAIRRAGSTDTEALAEAFKGLTFDSPVGPITFREIDHQSTMGAYVGTTVVVDGEGRMTDWTYRDGAAYLPDDATVERFKAGQ